MRIKILIAALLAAVAATIVPAARADCITDATVSYVGNDWGPVPLWRVTIPGATYDVNAADADAALAAAAPFISCPAPLPAPAAAAQPDPAPVPATVADPASAPASGPSDLAVGQATQIVTQADVTYVGNSWGPIPIWRVSVPSRNATYDVAAATADDARAAVLGAVAAAIDANPSAAPAAPSLTASRAQAPALAAATGEPVTVTADVIAPFAGVVAKTPAKSKTAKKGVHSTPATAKSRAN